MNARQCRIARAALNWSTAKLAYAAGVGLNIVNRFEAGSDAPMSSVDAMRRALEAAGIEFTDGERPGVSVGWPPPLARGSVDEQDG